jgi:hypothetical protein
MTTDLDDVPSAMRPLVWPLAIFWFAIRACARGLVRGLQAYDAGTAAVGRAAGRAGYALLCRLGPFGRFLPRLFTPLVRGARQLWHAIGRRAILFMFRPLGRFGMWLSTQGSRAAVWLKSRAVRLAVRVNPTLRRISSKTRPIRRAIAQTVHRLRAGVARAWAPVGRVATIIARAVTARVHGKGTDHDYE